MTRSEATARRTTPAAWAGGAALAAAVYAAALVASPMAAILLAAAAFAVGIAVSSTSIGNLPRYAALGALLVLTVYPPKVFGSGVLAAPETSKVIIIICLAPALVLRGVDLRAMAPAFLLPWLAITSLAFGKPPADLSYAQTVSSLVTLGLGWVVLAIRWRRADLPVLLFGLAMVGPMSVFLGLGLSAAGLIDLFREQGVARLSGAQIAAALGGLAAAGAGASVILAEMRGGPRASRAMWLVALNVMIVGATASRGPLIVTVVMILPWLALLIRRQLSASGPVAAARWATGIVVLGTAVALIGPGIAARNDTKVYDRSKGAVIDDPTSGRTQAWQDFLDRAAVSPYFGLGVGSGPILETGDVGFTAQHNEYLRAYVETGLVGLVALLAAIIVAFRRVFRGMPRGFLRRSVGFQILAFAVYSFTDNTLSSPYLAVSFPLLIGATAHASRYGRVRAGASHTATRTVRV